MLKFAQINEQKEEAEVLDVDRAKLREDYEAACRLGCAGAARLAELADTEGRTERDQVWLRHYRLLCMRKLSRAQQELGSPQEALASLKEALKCAQEPCVSLWRELADAAVGAKDWQLATQALHQCLEHWPGESELWRAQVEAALNLGDLPRSQKALAQLRLTSPREHWLQQRLKRRFELPFSDGSGWEAEYQALSQARRQRRRCASRWPAQGQALRALDVLELLESLRGMVAKAVPPYQPIYFFIRKEVKDGDAEELGSLSPKAFLESFRDMFVDPWKGDCALPWLLQCLKSAPELQVEEKRVSDFLGLAEGVSKPQPLRSWLMDVVSWVEPQKPAVLEVELLRGLVAMWQPVVRADELAQGQQFWAHSHFLNWVLQQGGAELRGLVEVVRTQGLRLAEICARERLVEAGRSLLRAWLYWHPHLGLSSELQLRSWLEEALGFDTAPPSFLADDEALAQVQSSCKEAQQFLNLGAQLLQGRGDLARRRCEALAGEPAAAEPKAEVSAVPSRPSETQEELCRRAMLVLEDFPSPTLGPSEATSRCIKALFQKLPDPHVVSKFLSPAVAGLGRMAEDQWCQVAPLHFLMLIRILRAGVQSFADAKGPDLVRKEASSCLHGRSGICLSQDCEEMVIASLFLAALLAKLLARKRISRDWCLPAHAALLLGLKALGALLQEEAGGLAKASCDLEGGSTTLSGRSWWSRLSQLLITSHDLSLVLAEHFVHAEGLHFEQHVLQTACGELFGKQSTIAESWRLSAAQEETSLMSMPHLLMFLALRADCPMLQLWRSRCQDWKDSLQEPLPATWIIGLRALEQEARPAPSHSEDLPEDAEIRSVLVRAIGCLWPLPVEALTETIRLQRFIMSDGNVYIEALRKSLQAEHYQKVMYDKKVVPHILALAVEVGRPSEEFWQALARQVDRQLFEKPCQELLHPLILNPSLVQLLSQLSMAPYNEMKLSEDLSEFVEAEEYLEMAKRRDALLKGQVSKRQSGKASLEEPSWAAREANDLAQAGQLLDLALSLRPRSLPHENPYLHLIGMTPENSDGVLQLVVWLVKALAISPRAELWSRLSDVYLRLCILQEDVQCQKQEWWQKLEAFSSRSLVGLSGGCRGHARILNLMQQSMLRRSEAPPQAPGAALECFQRRIQLLMLMKPGKSEAERRRSHHLALGLLCFIRHSTDFGDEVHSSEVTASPFEERLATREVIRFRSDTIPGPYLWFVPYVLAQLEWKLAGSASKKRAFGFIMDACRLEAAVRERLHVLVDEGRLPKQPARMCGDVDITYAAIAPHSRLQSMRLKVCLEEDWRLAAEHPHEYDCQTKLQTEADALQALEIFDSRKKAIMEARLHLSVNDLEHAGRRVSRLCQPGVAAPAIGCCEGRQDEHGFDPWLLEQTHRKEESSQLKALFAGLSLYRALLLDCLPEGSEVTVPCDWKTLEAEPSLPDLKGPKGCMQASQGHTSKVKQQMQSLSLNRPARWKELLAVTKELVNAVLATERSDPFRRLRAVITARAIREACSSMTKANLGQQAAQGARRNRPSMDWRFFSLFVSFSEKFTTGDLRMQQEVDRMKQSCTVAALRLHLWALTQMGHHMREGTHEMRFHDAKAFHDSLPNMKSAME